MSGRTGRVLSDFVYMEESGMDEIKFENRYVMTDADYREANWKYRFKANAVMSALIIVCAVVILIGAAIIRKYGGEVQGQFWIGGILAALGVFFLFIPKMQTSIQKQETLRLNNGKVPETVVSFGENIRVTEGAVSVTTEYSQIVNIRKIQRLYVLETGWHTGILIDPDAFTIGSLEDCRAFLNEKCQNLGKAPAIQPYGADHMKTRVFSGVLIGLGISALILNENQSAGIYILAAILLIVGLLLAIKPGILDGKKKGEKA